MKNFVKFSSMLLFSLGLMFLVVGDLRAFEIEKVLSSKGLKAWLVKDHKNPIITIKFSFKGGTSQDVRGKEGLAHLLSGLLDEGAGNLNSKDFQHRLNENSISMTFNATRDYFYGTMTTLTETSDEAFRLLGLAINAPHFDSNSTRRIKDQIVASLRADKQNPNKIVGQAWWRAAFKNHPYSKSKRGNEASLTDITAADLSLFRQRIFAKSNLIIGVVGDIKPTRLRQKLDTVFGDLAERPVLTEFPKANFNNQGEVFVISREIPQSVVVFGHEGLLRSDPDWYSAIILFEILAGGFGSRLTNEIREKRGLAYNVSAYPLSLHKAGLVIGSVSTVNDKVKQSINLIRKTWKTFSLVGPTEQEVRDAKSYLTGSFGLQFTNSRSIAGMLIALQKNGFDMDYLKTRPNLINQTSIEDLRRVAKKIFREEKLMFVVVGQPRGVPSTAPLLQPK